MYVDVYCPLLPSVCDRMVAVSSKYALILANQGVVVRDSEIVPVSDSEIVPVYVEPQTRYKDDRHDTKMIRDSMAASSGRAYV